MLNGAIDPLPVSKFLTGLGVTFIIYSSFSNGATLAEQDEKLSKANPIYSGGKELNEFHKWRLIIPCEYSRNQIHALTEYVVNLINENSGLDEKLDLANEAMIWSQPWFFPRVPDQRRKSLFFFKSSQGDYQFDVDAIHQAWLDTEKAHTEEATARRKQTATKVKDLIESGQYDGMQAFKKVTNIEQLMLDYGYVKKGNNRYLSPNSSSKEPGVRRLPDSEKWFSSHGSDGSIGRPYESGVLFDSFDLFKYYEHGNSEAKALSAVNNLFTIEGVSFEKIRQRAYQQQQSKISPDGGIQHLQHYNKSQKIAVSHCSNDNNFVVDSYNNLQQYNNILDSEQKYCSVDLLKYLDDSSLIKRLSIQTAEQSELPVNTAFLMLLGSYSSMACRNWCVEYANGKALPIGIYAVAEQPSGTGKSRCLSVAQKPFYEIKDSVIKTFKERLKALTEKDDKTEIEQTELEELLSHKSAIFSPIFITNSTPEGAEKTLLATNGFFSAVSSEQGLFNSLLGLSYSTGANNNDLVLNGFDGGYISSCRISRDGYNGHVSGGIVCFAQQGSVEKILDASNGTGLAERFLMLTEAHNLGKRDHLKQVATDPFLEVSYSNKCGFARNIFEKPTALKELLHLKANPSGYRLIAEYRNKIEPHLDDGGKFSHVSLRGAASKIDMQIMKVAANLHVIDRDDDYQSIIPDSVIKSSIGISNELLEANLALCQAKGIVGIKAEFSAILRMFQNNKALTERQIIQSRSCVPPFKDFTGNRSSLIRTTLDEMESQKILTKLVEGSSMKFLLNQ